MSKIAQAMKTVSADEALGGHDHLSVCDRW